MAATPLPQANDLQSVAAVIDAVAGGAVTDDVIAEAIGMVDRQGAYYANAAATLGYIEPHGSPRVWLLTPDGDDFLNMTVEDRADDLARRVLNLDVIEAYVLDASGDSLLAEYDLGPETLARRLVTLEAWTVFAFADSADRAGLIAEAVEVAHERTPSAVARWKAANAPKPPAPKWVVTGRENWRGASLEDREFDSAEAAEAFAAEWNADDISDGTATVVAPKAVAA